ncbi:uncharacterized protein SPSK_04336 [Sporothrix schenckii 1099-18]|uniref:BZIP domain-containing protein n=2 Tax=Sporothrix schenckii TaxID=29908 RepID=U7PTB3_SPOS1|nr:uncharacterized protein SPSK_04336 [Sporothrix schenckii 1099-18]ERS98847.1 hypothetical protein HMPREF1624_04037 [Sporothrix schenckii ATCC 58251]KJR83547.1 hypothetical protein SPSK_04336 [Sporothrix schenckii 1099-18]
MKQESRNSQMRGIKTSGSHAHGKKRRGAAPGHHEADHADMPYPSSHADGWQQEFYNQPSSAPATTRTTISALLNHEDGAEADTDYYAASTDRSTTSSTMTPNSTLSHIPPAPMDNSFASVVMSHQRSTTSLNGAYTYHAHESHIAHATYASDEDYERGKANLEYTYGYVDNGGNPHDGSARYDDSSSKIKTSKSRQARETKPKKNASSTSRSQKGSSRQKYTPTSATASSPAFSAPHTPNTPNTPSMHTPHLTSIGSGSIGSSGFDEDDDETDIYGRRLGGSIASRDTSAAPLGRPRAEANQPPIIQRERNRMAATKCRAKSKAAISKLEEDERAVTEERNNLFAQKEVLVDEVLNLRMELIRHGHCVGDNNIQNYLQNAARMIGNSGGRHMIWGPDGSGSPSGEGSATRNGSRRDR